MSPVGEKTPTYKKTSPLGTLDTHPNLDDGRSSDRGILLWDARWFGMSRRLSEIEAAYERLGRDMEPCYNRDVLLGQLMTELERDHKVPVLKSLADKMGDTLALQLYRRISDSRTFVLGMA